MGISWVKYEIPSGCVNIAIENGNLKSDFFPIEHGDFQ